MRIKLRVTPRSRADEVVGFREDGTLQLRVTAPPHEGQANEAVIRLLSGALGIPKARVKIQAGASSRDKWVEVDGVDQAELRQRLGREKP